MKGKLSRMLRSGLAMMLAVIMMFSLGTSAFAADADDLSSKYEEYMGKYNEVMGIINDLVEYLEEKGIATEENVNRAKALADALDNVLSKVDAYAELKADTLALKDKVVTLKDKADALVAERDALQADIDAKLAAAEASLAALNAKLDSLEAELAAAGLTQEELDLIDKAQAEGFTALTAAEIEILKAAFNKIEADAALKAELSAEIADVQNQITAVEAEIDALRAEADALIAKADALVAEVEALETDVADLVAKAEATIKDIILEAKELAEILYGMAKDKADADATEYYKAYYNSTFKGFATDKIDEVVAIINDVKADVEANAGLGASFKNRMVAALDGIVDTADALKNAVNNVAVSEIKTLADKLVANIEDAIELTKTINRGDLIEVKNDLTGAIEPAKDIARSVYETYQDAKAAASKGETTIMCNEKLDIVVLGDASATTYAQKVADALGANVTDLSEIGQTAKDGIAKVDTAKNADIVILGYGFDAARDFACIQMNNGGADLDWSAFDNAAQIQSALDAIEAELAAKLGAGNAEKLMIAIESYALVYANYIFDAPALVADLCEDTLVVVVGDYNPLKNVTVKDNNIEVALGKYVDAVLDASNLFNLANVTVMPNTVYVEIDNNTLDVATKQGSTVVTKPSEIAGLLYDDQGMMLPSDAGASAIADLIVAALTINVEHDAREAFLEGDRPASNTFRPESCLTRKEAAQLIYNLMDDASKVAYVRPAITFSDVASGTWYEEAVVALYRLDVIDGYDDGTFKPDKEITRAEFTKMVVEASDVQLGGNEIFSDVASNHWFYEYVCTAYGNKWLMGYDDGTFKPEKMITRAEATKIACGMQGCFIEDESYNAYWESLKQDNKVEEFDDVAGHWGYYWILEATNDHCHCW